MKAKKLLPFFVLFAIGVGIYFNALQNDYLWDDEFLLQKNQFLDSWSYLPDIFTSSSTGGAGFSDRFFRPMQIFSYMVATQLFGRSVVTYHSLNLALHILCSFMLFIILLNLFSSKFVALFASLLWLVHPVHTEAITYMSGTADPLGLFFVLWSLWTFLLYFERRSTYLLAGSLLFFLLTLLSKESFVILPGLLILCAWAKTRSNIKELLLMTAPFWALAVGFVLSRWTWLNFENSTQFYTETNIYTENWHYRLYTFLAALHDYFLVLFYPTDLHMERRFPVYVYFWNYKTVTGTLITTSLLTASAYRLSKHGEKLWLFGILWFFCSLFPMSGVVLPVNSFFLEHWLYLPSMGLFAMMAYFLSKMPKSFSFTFLVPAILSLSIVVFQQNKLWADPVTFYNHILSYHNGSARIHNNLAMAYADKEDFGKAEQHYRISLDQSKSYPQTYYNLARIYIRSGKNSEAIKLLQQSLKVNPEFRPAQILLRDLESFIKKRK